MKRLIPILLLIISPFKLAFAQADPPFPEPEAMFSSAVEIVQTEHREVQTSTPNSAWELRLGVGTVSDSLVNRATFQVLALPEDVEFSTWVYYDVIDELPISPDQRFLLLPAETPNHDWHESLVYSYEIATEELRLLGQMPRYANFRVLAWSNHDVLITTSEWPEWSMRPVYVADVTSTNSLMYATTRRRFQPEFQNDPPRIEFMSGMEGDSEQSGCSWVIYDVAARTEFQHDMGWLCNPEFGSLTGIGYYREVLPNNRSIATLVRYSPLTGERVDLYQGELEFTSWVSRDDRYAVLTIDHSGEVEMVPYLEGVYGNLLPGYSERTAVELSLCLVDLVLDEEVFCVPTDWDIDFVMPMSSIVQVDDNRYVALVHPRDEEAYSKLFTRTASEVEETRLFPYPLLTLDGGHQILHQTSAQTTETFLYNVDTGVITPVTRAIDDQAWGLFISVGGNNTLNVDIRMRNEPYSRERYTIRVSEAQS